MNPSLSLILTLLISFEITFTSNLNANLLIIGIILVILWRTRCQGRTFARLFLLPLIPASALLITIGYFSPSHDWYYGWVLVSRLYLCISIGTLFIHTTTPVMLARSLEQNLHLPSKYAYGVLAALNLVPRIKQTIITIRQASLMRGVTLHWWSPTLYFKAILTTMQWSDQLAAAMESHGFVEGKPRTNAQRFIITKKDWLLSGSIVIGLQIILIALPPQFMR